MNYGILPNGNLKITVDAEEQAELKETWNQNEDFTSDDFLYSTLETLVCNTELNWCEAEWVGALTSAPILCIFNKRVLLLDFDSTWEQAVVMYPNLEKDYTSLTRTPAWFYTPVDKHWGFMQYETTSPQEQLANKGYCIWQSGDN